VLTFLRRPDLLAFIAVGALTAFVFLPLCDALHLCGCGAAGFGGRTHCNVHRSEAPHCPWCAHPALGTTLVGVTLTGQWLAFRAARRRRRSPTVAALVATLSLPFLALPTAAALWLPTDYPHFVVRDARSRLGLARGPIVCGPAQATP
jgi:hypothetical protein